MKIDWKLQLKDYWRGLKICAFIAALIGLATGIVWVSMIISPGAFIAGFIVLSLILLPLFFGKIMKP